MEQVLKVLENTNVIKMVKFATPWVNFYIVLGAVVSILVLLLMILIIVFFVRSFKKQIGERK